MDPNSSTEIVRSPKGDLLFTPENVDHNLPALLLDGLERRWYQEIDFGAAAIQKMRGSTDLVSSLGLMQVYEVPQTEDLGQSLHLGNMQNVIGSLRDGSHALVYAISSRAQQVRLIMGVRRFQKYARYQTDHYTETLSSALRSNYPGIVLAPVLPKPLADAAYRLIPEAEYKKEIVQPLLDGHLACITGVPSRIGAGAVSDFVGQSIDRLVDGLRGKDYALLILAEPIRDERLTSILAQLRELSGEVHTLVSRSRSISRNRSETSTKTDSSTQTISVGAGQVISAIFGISATYSKGTSLARGTTDGTGASVTQETLDKTAQFCEQVLEEHIDRVQAGRSLGFWNVGIYLASDDFDTFMRAKGLIHSLYSGVSLHSEPIRVIDISGAPPMELGKPGIRQSLAHLEIPVLSQLGGGDHPLGSEYQGLATPLVTSELARLFGFPRREVPGLKLKRVTDFNLNPPRVEGAAIGRLMYRGEILPTPVCISAKSLTRHTFVTGLTGSGKTNTCLALLNESCKDPATSFLVIDPAKTEYRFLLHSPHFKDTLLYFTLNSQESPFHLNPFEFARGFPLLTHIDLLKAVFNAAFPMYASMPYLLEEALLTVYTERGWNLETSGNRYVDVADPKIDFTFYLPRLSDLYAQIDVVVESKRYGAQLTQDLSAALKARLGSLIRGGKGRMLDVRRSFPFDTLLRHPTVLELRRLGDDDEKAFIMALLFVRLYESCQGRAPDNYLAHVTLFEEAHRLLRNVPVAQSAESANARGKAVELFTDMMAEMRAYGEGFIIVDQMPNKLVADVVKGSNLKIVHRLLADDDRLAVGNSMGLTAAQIDHLPRLNVGEAVVHSEELGDACLVKIDPVEDELSGKQVGADPRAKADGTLKRLQERMAAFREEDPAAFRRFAEPPLPFCLRCGPFRQAGRCPYGAPIEQFRHQSDREARDELELPLLQAIEGGLATRQRWQIIVSTGPALAAATKVEASAAADVVFCEIAHLAQAVARHPKPERRRHLERYIEVLADYQRRAQPKDKEVA